MSASGVTAVRPDEPALALHGVGKNFGPTVAVDSLDMQVAAGTCVGLLGPNGAGKSTTINMLVGLERPDRGELRVLGRRWEDDAQDIREHIGVQLQETQLFDKLRVMELLRLFRSFYAEGEDPQAVLALIGLEAKRRSWYRDLSGGQKQRLALGCALVGKPHILFLDEPTTGLDPQARRRVWEVIETVRERGGTIVLTTHYMDEAERLCDQLVIVDQGRAIAEGTPAELIDSLAAESLMEASFANAQVMPDTAAVAALPGVTGADVLAGRLRVRVDGIQAALPAFLALLEAQGLTLQALETRRPTLEDVFVELTGRALRDG